VSIAGHQSALRVNCFGHHGIGGENNGGIERRRRETGGVATSADGDIRWNICR